MAPHHESSIPLLSPSDQMEDFTANQKRALSSFTTPLRRNLSLIRVAISGVILLTFSGFIFSMSSLYQGLEIVKELRAASQENLTTSDLGVDSSRVAPTISVKPSIPQAFYNFFELLRHPVTATSYTDVQGNIFETRGDGPWWTSSLGSQVLIVDIDTRLPDGKNELWNDGRLDWEHLSNGVLSSSQLNHYLYGEIESD